ncbi:MAG: DNA adenine methylase [Treponema sp.]|jgi:adenine-specific DNA-methyltransferase|nr:DNA adenine methylase [Treponema sp.]
MNLNPPGPSYSDSSELPPENEDYLTKQIITYLGNKRALLDFIGEGLRIVQKRLNRQKLTMFDVFSGSGIVARYFKRFAASLLVNDLEKYTVPINGCYLSNRDDLPIPALKELHRDLTETLGGKPLKAGMVTALYAPQDDDNIKLHERVFFTRRNAMYLDTARNLIDGIDEKYRLYFLAPLLSEASIHSNTSGVFKGFYKNKLTGAGQFGGSSGDALLRIKGDITLPFPVFSNFNCPCVIYNEDSNKLIETAPEVDMAYLDPPYNQHPYGSNYFMLNLIAGAAYPKSISRVSGIPADWNRSVYNKRRQAHRALAELAARIRARYVLVSFNSEGFIPPGDMKAMLEKIGKLEILETAYTVFRGARNLSGRGLHVKEYLYLLEK